jgi:Zn-finger nucleic acid-binding protein
MNLFVDNETVCQSSTITGAAVAVQTASLCPRCATLLDEQPIGAEGTFACPSCKGCWVPEGVLTRLHETYGRGGTLPFEEEALYVRAAKIQARQDQRTATQDVAKQGSSAELLYWYVIGGLISLILGVSTWESLRRVMAHSHWSGKIDEGFVLLLLGVAGGIALFVHGFRLNRRKLFIETTPTSTIRSLAVGLVEVTGKAEPASAMLNAPFSAMPCVFYYYMVEERQRHGKEEKWVTIEKGESSEPFVVRDATGGVTILPMGADLMLETRGTYQNTGSIELPPAANRD